jgi:hypothetical protein
VTSSLQECLGEFQIKWSWRNQNRLSKATSQEWFPTRKSSPLSRQGRCPLPEPWLSKTYGPLYRHLHNVHFLCPPQPLWLTFSVSTQLMTLPCLPGTTDHVSKYSKTLKKQTLFLKKCVYFY